MIVDIFLYKKRYTIDILALMYRFNSISFHYCSKNIQFLLSTIVAKYIEMTGKFTVVTRRGRGHNSNNDNVDYDQELQKYTKIVKAVEKLTAQVTRTFSDNMIESIRRDHNYCVLFKYNDNPEYGEVYNDSIDGIPTKLLLSGEWINKAKNYLTPIKCRSIATRINDYITDKKFLNGIDPVTKQKYNVSVFYYKSKDSVFKNGIIVSRDGIIYQ